MSRRLRVGVAGALATMGGDSGHGRVWQRVLAELAPLVTLTTGNDVDVRLVDGHAAPAATDRVPRVAVVHDVRWADPDQRDELPVMFLATIVPHTAAAIADATRVLVPSRFVHHQVVAAYGVAPAAVGVVPYGVDADIFVPRPHPRGGTPYVAFVGAVEPRKRVGVLRDAMTMLADRGLPHRLVLRVSSAPWTESRELLHAATAELPGHPGRVSALPRLDDDELAWMLAGADALCLPSECEGFGLPVLEAMACGTPVVVADRGALPELVGDAGVVVEPEARAVADALATLFGDPHRAAALATRGRDRALVRSWAATARGYVTELEAAVEAARRPGPVPHPTVVAPALPDWAPVRVVTACPVCGAGPTGDPVAGTADLHPCPGCGAVWADRTLDPDRYVEPVPRRMPAEWWGVPLDTDAAADQRARFAAARLALLARTTGDPGSLLVVGDDPDPLVAAAREAGWRATGTPVLLPHTDVTALAHPDAVWVAHRLGTASDVTATLRALARLPAPGGVLVVEVPNWASASRRRDGADWHHRRPLETGVHFDRHALRTALTRAGWTPESITVHTWPGSDRTAATHPLPPFRRPLRRLPPSGADTAVRALRWGYDRGGLGEVIVAIVRTSRPAPVAAAPRGTGADA